jgi:hypothetical protein
MKKSKNEFLLGWSRAMEQQNRLMSEIAHGVFPHSNFRRKSLRKRRTHHLMHCINSNSKVTGDSSLPQGHQLRKSG